MGGYGYLRAQGGNGGSGGAIFNLGALTAAASTFSGNSSGQEGLPGGFPTGGGGAIYNNYGPMTLNACTFSGNFILASTGGPGDAGGGLCSLGTSAVSLRNVILAGNRVMFSTNSDLAGRFTSEGHNLIGVTDESQGFTNGVNGDLTGTSAAPLDAKLGALKDNGGPTWTMALSPGSPALNQGDDALLAAPFNLTDDQRGLPRKSATHVDIGACELQAPNLIELRRSGSDIAITFTTEVNGHYRLQRTHALGSNSWTTVADNLAGTGGTLQVLDSGAATQPQYFYRGVMLP